MLRKLTLGLTLLTSLVIAEATITYTPYKTAAQYIGKGKPVMLEVGAESCVNCKQMDTILAPIMAQHPNYQIFDILLKAPAVNILDSRPKASIGDTLKVHAIPTQIFYDASGKEVYRHTGVLTTDQLKTVFNKLKF